MERNICIKMKRHYIFDQEKDSFKHKTFFFNGFLSPHFVQYNYGNEIKKPHVRI